MTTPAVEPQPYIMESPFVSLGGKEIHCLASHVELNPDTDTTDTTTFCGKRTFPGATAWHLIITLYQSFEDDGTDQVLAEIWEDYQDKGEHPDYLIRPYRNRPVGPNNPEFSGTATPMPYTIISGDAGDASTVELDWVCDQWPDREDGVDPASTRGAKKQKADAV